MKSSLILYTSLTGNTEKVAQALKIGFERHGWRCTLTQLPPDAEAEPVDIPFDLYDFVCVGSPVHQALPHPAVRKALNAKPRGRHKIVPGPKCGLVFCTYSGIHLGPQEAEPTLKLLALELEHLTFKVIGALAIPGKMGNLFTPEWYHGVMIDRPDAEDLKKADRFVDGIMIQLSEQGG